MKRKSLITFRQIMRITCLNKAAQVDSSGSRQYTQQGAENRNVGFIETRFIDRRDIIIVRYRATIDFVSKVKHSRSIAYEEICAIPFVGKR
jgi:hypothetical protein